MNRSYWESIGYLKNPDYLIVGAGLVGMYTAYFIKKNNPDADVLVVERGPFSEGASTKNAGFACFGSVSELLDDVDHYEKERVVETVKMRYDGLALSRKIFSDEAIGFDPCGGIEVFNGQLGVLFEKCSSRLDEANDIVCQATGIRDVFSIRMGNPSGCKGFTHYIYNKEEGSLNTALFNRALYELCLKHKVRFLFGINVNKVNATNKVVECGDYDVISADRIIVTTNGFVNDILHVDGVRAVRNQVLVTEKIPGLDLKGCYHMDCGYYYFRNVDQRLLIGGGRHVLGQPEETSEMATTVEARDLLTEFISRHIDIDFIPKIEYQWSGILGVGTDKKPIIKEVFPGIFIGVRMGGMGVAISSLVGLQLSELVLKNN